MFAMQNDAKVMICLEYTKRFAVFFFLNGLQVVK